VCDGSEVKIGEQTDYPFSDTIQFTMQTGKPLSFPLYLRVPHWCEKPEVKINNHPAQVEAKPDSFIVIDRLWTDGDQITLHLPMHLSLRLWNKNKDSISIDRGPLTFALDIPEKWQKYGGTDKWPEEQVLPDGPWNYGLIVNENDPAQSFEVVEKPGLLSEQPFTPANAPIVLRAKGKRIPAWTMNEKELLRPLQQSPVKSDQPTESLTLVPMGAARLRISAFPVIGDSPDAHDWTSSAALPKSSWCFEGDSTAALNDGILPSNSGDDSIPRFTWWPHKGTEEWVQYDFNNPKKLSSASVYWFDDTGRGGCRVPQSWEIQYLDGSDWKPVKPSADYLVGKDKFNTIGFDPIETKSIRLIAHLQPNFSAGILEWQIR
jgi:hypothetical protein